MALEIASQARNYRIGLFTIHVINEFRLLGGGSFPLVGASKLSPATPSSGGQAPRNAPQINW